MGGHGGLNILPQKRWNVYRFDNQEKVRVDEAEAARQDQLHREATRRRESHSRLVALRRKRGLQDRSPSPPRVPSPPAASAANQVAPPPPPAARPSPVASDGDHINLFSGGGGATDFAALASASGGRGAAREREPAADSKPNPKKRKKEEEVRTAGPDDEKYKLGYGLAGKGVAAPWYASKPLASLSSKERRDYCKEGNGDKRSGGKKSIEELREERRKREAKEKERERALLATTSRSKKKNMQPDRGYSSRYVR